jgi:CRP-like cAMP-binding protein
MANEILRSVSFLKDLSDEDLQLFSALLQMHDFKEGQKIVTEGEAIGALYIVCQGTVHIRRRAQKREMLLSRIGACGFFGEINLFDHGLATASVLAMKNVSVASIGYETLRSFMGTNPAAGYKIVSALMREVCSRLRQTNERFVNAVYWAQKEN